jgi:hypothetical protein
VWHDKRLQFFLKNILSSEKAIYKITKRNVQKYSLVEYVPVKQLNMLMFDKKIAGNTGNFTNKFSNLICSAFIN